jgi:cobalt-zinc-cadmium efflux system outer membrane protein
MNIRRKKPSILFLFLFSTAFGVGAQETEPPLGATVDGLLRYAKDRNPEYAAMTAEADAALARSGPAGTLPDPRFRVEWRDITKMGEQSPTLLPNQVGSTRYLLMQDIPWYGKRDLKREAAEFEAESLRARATGTWAELSTKIKVAQAQRFYVEQNTRLTREILDLMVRLEHLAQGRYANGLAAQQDVLRAQTEQTGMKSELLTLSGEQRQWDARLNALLARPSSLPLVPPASLDALPAPDRLDFASIERRVRERNPQLQAEDSRIRAAEKNRELSLKNRYPDFTVGLSPIQYGGAVKEWELMLELNIPLQQGVRRATERETESMVSAARSRKDLASNQVLAELSENLAGLDSARQAEELVASSLLPQAELTYRAALAGYETGKIDFATVLDAQRQIRQARQTRLKARTEAQMRVAEIERLLGEAL